MKQNLKKITKVIAICALLVLSSCEKDLYDEAIKNDKNLLMKNISLSDLSRKDNAKLFSSIDKVRNKNKDAQGKIVYDSINDIYFDDQSGKYIESADGSKSYTFPILKSGSGDKKIENIVFSLNKDGEYDTYKAKYNFTKEEMMNFTEQQVSNQSVTYTEITQGKFGIIVCVENMEWQLASTPTNGVPTQMPVYEWKWVVVSTTCHNLGADDGTFIGDGGGAGNTSTTIGSSNTSASTPHQIAIVTTPIGLNATQQGMADMMAGFTDAQLNWYNNQNDATLDSVTNYLVQNSFSSASVNSIKQMMNLSITKNIEIDFNVNSNNLQTFNTINDVSNYVNLLRSSPQDTGFGTSNSLNQNQFFSTKTIQLTAIHDLVIEVVCNKQPFSLVDSSCTSFLDNIIIGNSWVQNSISLTNVNFNSTSAQITLVGYINVGIKLDSLEFGVKQRKKIKFLIDKTTGIICCTSIENLN